MIKVGIVGGTGYTGVELLRLLAQHPQVELRVITSRSEAGSAVSAMFPNLRGFVDLAFSDIDPALLRQCDVVFFATPNGTAMTMVRDLLEAGVRVIDLAADFRLKDAAQWEQWYGMPHACPELLAEAVYGLPEMNRSVLRTSSVFWESMPTRSARRTGSTAVTGRNSPRRELQMAARTCAQSISIIKAGAPYRRLSFS